MAFNKIGEWIEPVVSLDNKPNISADQLKAAFDSNSNQIREIFNAFIDAISAASAAGSIGTQAYNDIAASTVQAFLQALSDKIDNLVIEAGAVSSVFGRAGDVVASLGDYRASQIVMTGYAKGSSNADIATTDNVSSAFGKVENKIGAKQSKVIFGTTETPPTGTYNEGDIYMQYEG